MNVKGFYRTLLYKRNAQRIKRSRAEAGWSQVSLPQTVASPTLALNGDEESTRVSFPSRLCSYLGCAEDPDSVCGYPTDANVCYAVNGSGDRFHPVTLVDQTDLCLGECWRCARYQRTIGAPGIDWEKVVRNHKNGSTPKKKGPLSLIKRLLAFALASR